jgi:phosphoglucosamine mutase
VDRPHFGTDGLRGNANRELTVELALAIGRAAARVFRPSGFVVGRDTRQSGSLLQAAICAGIAAEGVDVFDVGVIPTPGVAACSAARDQPAVIISASHNPFSDNGIKLLAPGGLKLSVEAELGIEAELDRVLEDPESEPARPTGAGVGRIVLYSEGYATYRAHLIAALEGRRLDGLKVVIDGANGAASAIAPDVFEALGAQVTTLACTPDGTNINDACGSTHPRGLAAAVLAEGADLGLAFDGDADRLIAVDARGTIVDGDSLLALFAVDLKARGELTDDTVVVTVMTNLGFHNAMATRHITVLQTPVGDRHVLAELEAKGLALGGEQSGHIIFRRRATTGDGTLSGLMAADLMVRSGKPLDVLLDGLVKRLPQVIVNVAVAGGEAVVQDTRVRTAVADAEALLGTGGRVLLRPSGTEPLVRVMVEASGEVQAQQCADSLADAVRSAAGDA